MNAVAMDTLEAARGLEAAGFEREKADAVVRMVAAAVAAGREDLTTKTDLAEFKAEFKAELAVAVNKMLLSQIAVVGILLAAMAVLLAVLKFS